MRDILDELRNHFNPTSGIRSATSDLVKRAAEEIERLRGVAQAPSKEERFCHWLKGYLGAIKDRDELDAREANIIRNNLNEMLDGASPVPSTKRVSQEALDWATSEAPAIEAFKAANPGWEKDAKDAREVIGAPLSSTNHSGEA